MSSYNCLSGVQKMPSKNAVSWNALISGSPQNGFASLFVKCSEDAFECRILETWSALISGSALKWFCRECTWVLVRTAELGIQTGFVSFKCTSGKSINGFIVRRLRFNQVLSTALIDIKSHEFKIWSPLWDIYLFNQIDSKDSIFLNVMISSYCNHGPGTEALSLFLEVCS